MILRRSAFSILVVWSCCSHQALAQPTAFTYQGRLFQGDSPAHGIYDFRFTIYYDPQGTVQAGSAFLTNSISVAQGLFTTAVDFGRGVFAGSNCWLEVGVRTNGSPSYTILKPLQNLTPAPYAQFATVSTTASNLNGSLPASQIAGTLPIPALPSTVVTNYETGVTLVGAFSGNGNGLTNLDGRQISGLNAVCNIQVFNTNGTFVVPTNVSKVMVELWGGGGGGGAYGSPYFGGGGGGGGYGKGVFAVAPGQTCAVTVGRGGTGASAGMNNATGGGNSSFARTGFSPVITATGGSAGSTASGTPGTPGSSGSSDGALSMPGGYAGGNGAPAGSGGAGGTTITVVNQMNGVAPGGGGAGGNGTFPSGSGASGRVVIYY